MVPHASEPRLAVDPAPPARRAATHAARAALGLALALAVACLLPAPTAFAQTATPTVTLTLKAPTVMRKSAAFYLRGTASAAASPGETITVTLSRLGRKWSVVSTSTAALSATRTFGVRLRAEQRGHWRVSASLPETATHKPSSASSRFKLSLIHISEPTRPY
jgi:hypothetical protein